MTDEGRSGGELQEIAELRRQIDELKAAEAGRGQAEEALRGERDKLVAVFEAMADGVYVVNRQHDIQYVNPPLARDFGSWEGRKCYEYFHDRREACPWCKNADVFAGKTVR
ncbi:MAG: hypothetical protein ACYTFI_27430, partial [Planctomycetota bacterium]